VDGYRSVTTRDAHAWVEVWFPGQGWTTFDPTPLTDGRTVVPPYVQEAVADAPGDAQQPAPVEEEVQPLPEPAIPDAAEAPVPEDAPQPGPAEGDGGGVPILLPLLLVLVLALLATPFAVRRVLHRRRLAAAAAGGAGAGRAAWDEVLATSRDLGAGPDPADTVRGTARGLVAAHDLDDRTQDDLRELVRLVEEEWYGGVPPRAGALAGPVDAVLAALRGGSGGRRAWRARVLPRSLLSSVRLPRPTEDRTPVS
jgi:hypothetical protein